MIYKLGKLAAREDPHTLRLARYLAPSLREPPKISDWSAKAAAWPMYQNDQIGDCAIAMVGHARHCWSDNDTDQAANIPTEQQVIDGYSRVGGYRPGNPTTDRGCVMLDVLETWRLEELCGGNIRAYAKIHKSDLETALMGCHYFGGLLMGVQLPLGVQGKDEWLAPPREVQFGEWSPGGWGGHAVFGCGYDTERQRLKFVSWGKVMEMSFNFLTSYADEIYVAVSADFFGPDFTAPSGVDMNLLLGDLSAIRLIQGN
jgi:hypothetical protein